MNWSIDFAPMLPWPVLAGLAARRCRAGHRLLVLALARGAAAAPSRWPPLLLAARSTRRCARGAREPLPTSPSSSSTTARARRIAGRTEQTAAIKRDLEAQARRASAICEVRMGRRLAPTASGDAGTHLFADSQQRARQYAARPAGRRHHDHRRPGARRAEVGAGAGLRCARACAAHRPARTSSTAASRCSRRRATASSAQPRDIEVARRRRPARERPRRPSRVTLKIRREGRTDETRTTADRPHRHDPDALPARRAEHRRDRARDGAGRADAGQQPRGGGGRGRAREPARAAGLRRAACRRAHLAQPLEVRRRRRPRALHHFAPAARSRTARRSTSSR